MLSSRSNHKSLYIIGGIAAWLQLATILTTAIVMATLGPKPETAKEFFTIQQSSTLAVVLRSDFPILILIGLYLGTFTALYSALRRTNPVYTALAALFTFIVVTSTFSSDSTFSLLRLGKQYVAATTEAQRAQFLAAGEAVIASDLWNNSGAYLGGILLQGAGVIISAIMLRCKDFSKVTAYSGLIGNALDLFQHVIHPFFPSISELIVMFMGLFYLVWFVMLGRDLLRLGFRKENST